MWSPVFECVVGEGGEREYRVGHELIDEFLEFVGARARPNTVKAYAHDLKVFFAAVGKDPVDVTPRDVLAFVSQQRQPRPGAENVVRLVDGSGGLSAATIKRRLAAVSALYAYLVVRGDAGVTVNPVPCGLPTRQHRHRGPRVVPLVRGVRRLPRILEAADAEALLAALRTERDRAIVQAMLLAGLRRCEVLGLRLEDLRLGEWRVFVADGKGERPTDAATDRVFVALKGPTRGRPLSAAGLDEVLAGARGRAGLSNGTCHELRHTCFTRLRQAGMGIEALQALAGHRSIESTRVYLHLGADWLADEYRRAAESIDADMTGSPR